MDKDETKKHQEYFDNVSSEDFQKDLKRWSKIFLKNMRGIGEQVAETEDDSDKVGE